MAKLQLCKEKRDHLLHSYTAIGIVIAVFDIIMSSECNQYRQKRRGRPKSMAGEYEAEWDHFIGVARAGSRDLSDCMAALKTVSQFWGWDKIKHYKWVYRGFKYCKGLRAAANKNPDWSKASMKLCWLELRRTQLPRGRSIRIAIDPLEPADLSYLKEWDHTNPFIMGSDPEKKPLPFQTLTRVKLPKGLGFDRFGLLVREQFAMEYSDSSSPATISNNQHHEMNTGLDSDDEVVDEIIRYLDPYVATHSPPDDGAANQVPRDKPGVTATFQQGGSHKDSPNVEQEESLDHTAGCHAGKEGRTVVPAHAADASTRELEVQTDDERANDLSNTTENQRGSKVGPDFSTHAAKERSSVKCAVLDDSTSADEVEEHDEQPFTRYPSPGPSNGEEQPKRRSHRTL